MSFITLILQGIFFGYVLSNFIAIDTEFVQFMAMCTVNTVLVVAHGLLARLD
jgi:hypothetical protein